MATDPKPKRPLGLTAYVLVLVGAGLVGGLAGGLHSLTEGLPAPYGVVANLAVTIVAMAIGLAACIWWWRGIDEAAREAHKWAWWWGGSGGMAVVGMLLLILTLNEDDGPSSAELGLTPADLIAGGMGMILMFQVAGYAVAWAAWWLKHR